MTVAPAGSHEEATDPAANPVDPVRRRWFRLTVFGVLLALILYYPVGAWRADVIDDDTAFAVKPAEAGQSAALAIAAGLIRREIDGHGWAPNRPFNFQRGEVAAVGRLASEMDRRLGQIGDGELARAALLLRYPADVWMVNLKAPWEKTISTEKQYRNAARALEAFNKRVAAGQPDALFVARPDVLGGILVGFAEEVELAATTLEESQAGAWLDGRLASAFYSAKGRAYASFMILRALGEDYRSLLVERNLDDVWQAMLGSLEAAATARPWIVLNGGGGSALVPNHLAWEGFRLLRAERRMISLAEALR